MYHYHDRCRACGSSELVPVFDLGLQPLANDFCYRREDQAGFAPLKVLFCPVCSLAQLSVTVEPEVLYRDYPYITSQSATMRGHFLNLIADMKDEGAKGPVVEIGSNDGYFMTVMQQCGLAPSVGIDPASNLCKVSVDRGFQVVNSVFNKSGALKAREFVDNPGLIVARHVFCHADNWAEFIDAIGKLATTETLIVIEAPWALHTMTECEFDQVYHEHLSYLSVRALGHLLYETPFRLQKVIQYPVHGGSIAVMIRHRDNKRHPHQSVTQAIMQETDTLTESGWRDFSKRAYHKIHRLQDAVSDAIVRGETVCGFGASAKSTVWLNACRFDDWHVKFVTDNTPQKIGRFSPGSKIPVISERDFMSQNCKNAILFAWNYAAEIASRYVDFTNDGGRFINPHSVQIACQDAQPSVKA